MHHPHDTGLTFEMQNQVDAELQPDETLVWKGRRVTLGSGKVVLIFLSAFGFFFTAFSVFWIGLAIWLGSNQNDNAPMMFSLLFPLFGVPFLLVGLGMLTSPFWLAKRMKNSFYALTNKRAIVWSAYGILGGQTVKSFEPDQLTDVFRNESSDGTGDLVFREFFTASYRHEHGRRRHRHLEGFLGIANVAEVERLLNENLGQ